MTTSLQPTSLKQGPEKAPGLLQAKKASWWKGAAAFVLYLCVAVLVLEGFFRFARVGQQEFLQPDPALGVTHIADKTVTWRLEGYSCDRFNHEGLRDTEHSIAKPEGVYRVALLGDSATEAMQVNIDETYGKVLESMLNQQISGKPIMLAHRVVDRFEVINFGCSSYSTGQELFQYRSQIVKYDPDAVVLLFNRGDNAENVLNRSAADSPEPRPYFFLDNHGQLKTDNTVLQANMDKLQPNPILDFLRAHSRIYGVFNQTHLSLSLTDSRYRKFHAWLDRTCALAAGKPLKRTSTLNYPQQDGLKVTTALMKTLACEVKGAGRCFVLMIFPNLSHDAYFASQIALLKELSQSEKFSYLDLTSTFTATKNPYDYFLWYHFSPLGHRLVAKTLADTVSTDVLEPPNRSQKDP
jgi:hypothetical protein